MQGVPSGGWQQQNPYMSQTLHDPYNPHGSPQPQYMSAGMYQQHAGGGYQQPFNYQTSQFSQPTFPSLSGAAVLGIILIIVSIAGLVMQPSGVPYNYNKECFGEDGYQVSCSGENIESYEWESEDLEAVEESIGEYDGDVYNAFYKW